MTNAVLVVELRLGDRVIHVDGREQELAVLEELVEPVHSRGGLFRHALDSCGNLGETTRVLRHTLAQDIEHDPPLGRVVD